ncbi:MAG: hypothetical protein HY244_16580, partial [Rhizobiales bacterium]|nr:hypothetical protein [Hyphomicrobiales bacterium]
RHELFSEPFILLVPRSVPVHHVTFSSLLDSMPLIRHSSRSPIGLRIEQHLRRLRIVAPMYVEFDSIESIISAVSLGKGWAISAPTLLLQGLREQHAVSVRTLPAPGLSRSFALLARSGELGNAPSAIAQLARQILKQAVLPRICTLAPFLKDQFEIPSLGGDGLGEH